MKLPNAENVISYQIALISLWIRKHNIYRLTYLFLSISLTLFMFWFTHWTYETMRMSTQLYSSVLRLSAMMNHLFYKVFASPIRSYIAVKMFSYMTNAFQVIMQSIFLLISHILCFQGIYINGLNILVHSPAAGRSHMNFMGSLADLLVDAGHTVVNYFLLDSKKFSSRQCIKREISFLVHGKEIMRQDD